METVTLKPLLHNGAENIGIYSATSQLPSGENLNYYFQKKGGARWSRTNKCWYVPCTEKSYEQLAKALKGVALLQVDELKKYLLEKKKSPGKKNLQVAIPVIPPGKPAPAKIVAQQVKQTLAISKENKEALQKFTQHLLLKSYSSSTIKTYRNEFTQFLQLIKGKPANEFTVQRIHPVGSKK